MQLILPNVDLIPGGNDGTAITWLQINFLSWNLPNTVKMIKKDSRNQFNLCPKVIYVCRGTSQVKSDKNLKVQIRKISFTTVKSRNIQSFFIVGDPI